MNNITQLLSESLQTGFINHLLSSNEEYLPQLLFNDSKSHRKILTTIETELRSCDEFWFSVAFATSGGITSIFGELEKLQRRGKKGKVLVSQFLNFTQPEALKKLLQFKNIELKIAVNGKFHAKGYLFKKSGIYNLLIGSSNLTENALSVNKEWNLKVSATTNSYIINETIKEFTKEFDAAVPVDENFISDYEILYSKQFEYAKVLKEKLEILKEKATPNSMQEEALTNLELLRSKGKTKALVISATGTGKTFLSAFDAKQFNAKKLLFVVHRLNIAEAAKKTFEYVFGNERSMGMYSGSSKELGKDFVFSTVQTISKEENLKQFTPDYFDYIIIDETHRAAADSYKRILAYFEPTFALGMTATPERTDRSDIYGLFNHNIAYEIRLQRALSEDMLAPFHYFGITEIEVNGKELEDKSDFSLLTAPERIKHIIQKAKFYGCDNGHVRGLIFCSSVDECIALSSAFNLKKYKTVALTKDSSDEDRAEAIRLLQSDDSNIKLDYIFTRDIFNEGIDIPRVNQVILLRPTESSIIFVQQLGRGLRKTDGKSYLTVLDFIGNYSNNFMVPIALYGDTSFNQDTLRRLMVGGNRLIPGASTINFDEISYKRIFESIDKAKLGQKKDLIADYTELKNKLNRSPMMMDFVDYGSRDPMAYVDYSKSYFNFVRLEDNTLKITASFDQIKILELFSNEINNSKRVEESILLKLLIEKNDVTFDHLKKEIFEKYNYVLTKETFLSCINNLNLEFITEKHEKKMVSAGKKYSLTILEMKNNTVKFHSTFLNHLKNDDFKKYLFDNIKYSIRNFNNQYEKAKYCDGFVLYRKYSRKDVFRILNWRSNPVAQNVGGYLISEDKTKFPIFVTYHKKEDINESIKYEDGFENSSEFEWETKNPRTLSSPEVELLKQHPSNVRILLFIQKNNDEGLEFYYMGDVKPIKDSFRPIVKPRDGGKVVKIRFKMNQPVDESIYNYITNEPETDSLDENLKPKHNLCKIIPLHEVKPYINSVPLYNIRVAAGNFSELQSTSDFEWVELPEPFKASEEYFVCKVVGESMNKIIPNNSWCLFKKDPGGSKEGKVVLAQHANIQDSDFGAGYTIKSYSSRKDIKDESWRHESITLKPKSTFPHYKNIIIDQNHERNLKVIGIFVSVLK